MKQNRPGRLRRRLTALGLAALASGTVIGVIADPAFAVDLGGLDMNDACQRQHGEGFMAHMVPFTNVDSWTCVNENDPNDVRKVDVTRQCREQYNEPKAYAAFYDYRNPFSLYCKVD
ncbi:hypothetical protein AB0K60_34935 [Thermopolyspora sp. NPDC052614]|uniref:hypothetical protein n=1 Tax=Thermopolyspora sp. NPDC052614 TaxID=3155682 RepID=UPI0034434C8E